MSYNAIIRSKEKRVWAARFIGGTMDTDEQQKYQGWEVGSSQGSCIGIPARLVRKINQRTTPLTIKNGAIVKDDRNLVVFQNTLSGVGRYRSQFNVDADGILAERYYIDIYTPTFCSTLHNNWSFMFLNNKPNSNNTAKGEDNELVYQILSDAGIVISPASYFGIDSWINCSMEATNMEQMFQGCYNLMSESGLNLWQPLLVTNMRGMFQDCTSFEEDLGDWDITKVTEMRDMFLNTPMMVNTKYSQRTVSGWCQTLSSPNVGGADPSVVFTAFHTSPQPGHINLFSYVFFKNNLFQTAGQKWTFGGPIDPIYGNPEIWAVSRLTNMSQGFLNKEKFNLNLSLWDTANVEDMSELFHCDDGSNPTFNNKGDSNINNWDVAKVTTMLGMFWNQQEFNQPLDKWDTSSVTSMYRMFSGAGGGGGHPGFNQDIGSWNVGQVRNMNGMFSHSTTFNNGESDNIKYWNVDLVTDMAYMFENNKFNQPIGIWNVENVKNMKCMFNNSSFNRDISKWNVASVTSMNSMFAGAIHYNNGVGNNSINNWNVNNITDASGMFMGARFFNQDLSSWIMNVTNNNRHKIIKNMFVGVPNLLTHYNDKIYEAWSLPPMSFTETDLKNAGLRKPGFDPELLGNDWSEMFNSNPVNNMTNPNNHAMSLWSPNGIPVTVYDFLIEHGINWVGQPHYFDWSPASADVTDMHNMFKGCDQLFSTEILSSWDTSKVTNMENMFYDADTFYQDLGGWNINSVTKISNMFTNSDMHDVDTYGSGTIYSSRTVAGWVSKNPGAMAASGGMPDTIFGSIQGWNQTSLYRFSYAFLTTPHSWLDAFSTPLIYGSPPSWSVSRVTNMDQALYNKNDNVDISLWDTANVTSMNGMFMNASQFNQDIGKYWDVSKVTSMENMFYAAEKFDKDISEWNVAAVTNMDNMFNGAKIFDQYLFDWNVSSVTSMKSMFDGAKKFNQDIENWNVAKVINMSFIFNQAEAFDKDITKWNVSSVTSMESMFFGAENFDQDIKDWNVSNVTSMKNMFNTSYSLFNHDLSKWKMNLGNNTNIENMFALNNALSRDNNNKIWNTWTKTMQFSSQQLKHANLQDPNFNPSELGNNWSNMWLDNMANPNNPNNHVYHSLVYHDLFFVFEPHYNTSEWHIASSTVTDMHLMFESCPKLIVNQTLDHDWPNFDTSLVTDMHGMFMGCNQFNVDISTNLIAGTWDVVKVKDMAEMFMNATEFNQDLGNWNIQAVTDITKMFLGAAMNQYAVEEYNASRTMAGFYGSRTGYTDGVPTAVKMGTNAPIGWDSMSLGPSGDASFSYVFFTNTKFQDAGIDISNSDYITYGPVNQWCVSRLDDMTAGFQSASTFNQDISMWDVANVTNMDRLFDNSTSFNQPLNDWSVSAVNTMQTMFGDTHEFNQPLKDWNVATVTNMNYMFWGTNSFNQNIGNWNVAAVTHMNHMFGNSIFNQNINNWNVAAVTDMNNMFNNNHIFNQDIHLWSTSNVLDMSGMFMNAKAFDSDIGNNQHSINSWVVTKVTSMRNMFNGAINFNNGITPSKNTYMNWTTSKVIDMSGMFMNAINFNQDITNWIMTSVKTTNSMFYGATNFNNGNDSKINNWNFVGITDMGSMFKNALVFNQPINTISSSLTPGSTSSWDVSTVKNMRNMFDGAAKFDQDLGNWNIQAVTDVKDMFLGAAMNQYAVGEYNASRTMAAFYGSRTGYTDGVPTEQAMTTKAPIGWDSMSLGPSGDASFSYVFFTNTKFIDAGNKYTTPGVAPYGNVNQWCVSRLQDMNSGFRNNKSFNDDLNMWDVENVTNMAYLFGGDETSIQMKFNSNITGWITNNVQYMNSMFRTCDKFNQSISSWNTSNVLNMNQMFDGANAFNANISTWNTGKVTDMWGMFASARVFTSDISNWNTSNVLNMNQMFSSAFVFNANISTWNTGKVTDMIGMFSNTTLFNEDISNWDTSNVTHMDAMFGTIQVGGSGGAKAFNKPIGKWNTSKLKGISNMFDGALLFNQDLGNWNLNSLNTMDEAFANSPMRGGAVPAAIQTINASRSIAGWVDNKTGSEAAGISTRKPQSVFSGSGGFKSCRLYQYSWVFLDDADFTAAGQTYPGSDSTYGTVDKWCVSRLHDMAEGFENNFDPIFSGGYTLFGEWHPSADLSMGMWDTANVTDMSKLFYKCHYFNQNISDWNVSKVANMSQMFHNCTGWIGGFLGDTVWLGFNQNISNWNVSNVTNMSGMFYLAYEFNQNLTNWNVSKVINMQSMFSQNGEAFGAGVGTTQFNGDMTNWNVSSVTSMKNMFGGYVHLGQAPTLSFNNDSPGTWIFKGEQRPSGAGWMGGPAYKTENADLPDITGMFLGLNTGGAPWTQGPHIVNAWTNSGNIIARPNYPNDPGFTLTQLLAAGLPHPPSPPP